MTASQKLITLTFGTLAAILGFLTGWALCDLLWGWPT